MVFMSILLKYNNELSIRALGFPIVMEIEAERIMIMIIFLLSATFFLSKCFNFYFEQKKICYIINLFGSWLNNLDFKLEHRLAEKLSMHINISFRWVFLYLTKSIVIEK